MNVLEIRLLYHKHNMDNFVSNGFTRYSEYVDEKDLLTLIAECCKIEREVTISEIKESVEREAQRIADGYTVISALISERLKDEPI